MINVEIPALFRDWCKFLKNSDDSRIALLKSIKITDENNKTVGFLIPFTYLNLDNSELINKLTVWRNEHKYAYPSQFVASLESTKLWLQNQVLDNPDRMLFWVADDKLQIAGHLGVILKSEENTFEVDNVLRGLNIAPGIMAYAMKTLELEVEKEFSPKIISLRVLESNKHAINFYFKLGYVETSREMLKSTTTSEGIRLEPGVPAVDAFLTLSKSLENLHPIKKPILTAGPSISSREVAFVFDATLHGWNSRHSSYISQFEEEFAELVGSKYAMATSSCSGALHLSLLSLGIGPGDEVIVPDLTWVATASVVRYVGATPVFADINSLDWTISLSSINKLVTSRTRAIIPVHLYGFGAASPEIMEYARSRNLYVVEDAAPAIGTLIDDKKAGSYGDFGCFSFQGAKLLVTGEGGMLVTNNSELYAKARKIQDHGRKPGTFWIEELGYKYKMNNVTAALGLGQIQRSENQILRKRRINSWYKENLENQTSISFQEERLGTQSICWMTSILLKEDLNISRNEVMRRMADVGIDTRPTFPSISQYTFWPTKQDPQAISTQVADRGINLPSGVMLNRSTVDMVSEELVKILNQ